MRRKMDLFIWNKSEPVFVLTCRNTYVHLCGIIVGENLLLKWKFMKKQSSFAFIMFYQ